MFHMPIIPDQKRNLEKSRNPVWITSGILLMQSQNTHYEGFRDPGKSYSMDPMLETTLFVGKEESLTTENGEEGIS